MKICKSYLTKIKKAEYFTLKSDVVSLPCSFHYSFYDYCNLCANSNAFIYFIHIFYDINARIYLRV